MITLRKFVVNHDRAISPMTVGVLLGFCLLINQPKTIAEAYDDEALDNIYSFSLEQLLEMNVTTASKSAEKVSLAPAAITIVTAADIAFYGYESVAEVLSHQTGFVNTYDLVTNNFGVRGIHSGARAGSRNIKFMIDGQSINFRSGNQNLIGRELIPMDMIKHIEIIRGPVAALYGANALLGLVNIVTRDGSDFSKIGSAISIEKNTIDKAGNGHQIALTGGGNNNSMDYGFGVSASKQNRSEIQLPAISPSISLGDEDPDQLLSEDDLAKTKSFYGKVNWELMDSDTLQLTSHYQELDAANAFSDLAALSPTGNTTIALRNWFTRVDYRRYFSDNLQGRFVGALAGGEPMNEDRIEIGVSDFYLERELEYTSVDFSAELHWQLNNKNSFLLGSDVTKDRHELETFSRINRITKASDAINLADTKTITNTGLYAQYSLEVFETSQAIFGYRYDDNSQIDGEHSWRMGLVSQFDNALLLKILAGTAYQAPSQELLFRDAVTTGDLLGNPDLTAQRATTAEVILSRPLGKLFYVSGTVFKTRVDDLVAFEFNYINVVARNSASSDTLGFELESRFHSQNWSSYFNYSYQDTDRNDNPISLNPVESRSAGELMPKNSANFGLSFRNQQPWFRISLDNSWMDERPASTINSVTGYQQYQISEHFLSTLSIVVRPFSLNSMGTSEVRFQVRDLFDQNPVDPGFGGIDFPSLGRQFSLSFQQRF